jgi:sortase A
MFRRKSPRDLSYEELRKLLIEKRKRTRTGRLDHFRKTGRVVNVVPDRTLPRLDDWQSDTDQPALTVADEAPLPKRSGLRSFFDGLLLMVEIGAVLLLGYVLFNGVGLLQDLNSEVASVLQQPTLTATPLVIAAVLPSGHTPPNSPGGAQPNDAEIPEHLRPLVQSLASIPIPTPGPEQAVRIQIPALDIDAPIVTGDGWEQLKKGVGHHLGSANPGETGNLVLSAHNDIFGEIFRHLDQLQTGDEIIVYTNQRSYTYVVTVTKVVEPTQVEVMAPTHNATTTLISCYPYLVDNLRYIVHATLQDS